MQARRPFDSGHGRPTFMDPAKAGAVLREKLDARAPVTVADAAARSGLALRDADRGLAWLSSEYRGQLRVTSEGELVHVFPHGFRKPWETRDAAQRVLSAVGRALAGAVRFVVRAWVAIVLVAYAAMFLALVLGVAFGGASGGSGRDDRRSSGGELFAGFFRVVADALFWTLHPWSPFAVGWYAPGLERASRSRSRRRGEARVPLYERVNRFFFGPPQPSVDPRENDRLVVATIRANKGRIGLADVMRVTGLPREQADPMMARLMLDYDGDVDVSEEGGIAYRFESLRKTAQEAPEPEPPAAWARAPRDLPPLTGNSPGANFVVGALNAFNLAMSAWAIANGMTVERVVHMFDAVPRPIVDPGVPIALGIVPLVFSLLLFAVPAARAVVRPLKRRELQRERGRLEVMRVVLDRVRDDKPVSDADVAAAWQRATGAPPDAKRLDRALVALGGDVEIQPSGATRWRFADLETEAAAVEAEREAASEEEARLGDVVFATDERR